MRWNMRGVRFWGGREQHVYIRWRGVGGVGTEGRGCPRLRLWFQDCRGEAMEGMLNPPLG